MNDKSNITPHGNPGLKYGSLVSSIETLLNDARAKVVREVNRTIVFTYWHIGRYIVEYEQGGKERAEYGTELLKRLSQDLTKSFGKGYSYRNLQRIKQFYQAFPIVPSLMAQSEDEKWPTLSAKSELSKVQSAIAQLSWTHFVRLLSVKNEDERNFYLIETAENNWSVRELDRQVNGSLY
ncbi:MAG TPA: DUF1016 family protein [Ignavibacteria bacterium]|nr:DUF1016 family protein [Ignavibacteria bacterium]